MMSSISPSGFALDDGMDPNTMREVSQKFDLILRRLDAIEARLAVIEEKRGNLDISRNAEKSMFPGLNSHIRWTRPNSSAVDPSVDSGMIIDGIQRSTQQKMQNPFQPIPNQQLPSRELIEIVPLPEKR